MSWLFHEQSWTDAKEYFSENDTVILPIGAIEQHGPHNPLGTDFLIAETIAREAAKRTRVLCLPTVPIGVSSHHRQFTGTLYVNPHVFNLYVKDICLAAWLHGAKKIVIVNGHGGNLWELRSIAQELRQTKKSMVSIFQWWQGAKGSLPDLFPPDARSHGGSDETSMNLLLNPKLVKMERAVDFISTVRKTSEVEGIYIALEVADRGDLGSFGRPTLASKEKGKILFDTALEILTKHIETVKQKPFTVSKPQK